MVDIFVKQLDGCTFVDGGLNCTCAAEAMWLFRASRGSIRLTACRVRQDTGDRQGGTHLGQMEQVSIAHGITTGRVFRPATFSMLETLMATGRYGAHVNISYRLISGTKYDCFSGRFKGNHDYYVSGMGSTSGTWRVGDPGADGRRAGIPRSYQDIPISLIRAAAADLDLGGRRLGTGLVYTYITPPDPVPPVKHFASSVIHATSLWNDATQRWVYNGPNAIKIGTKLEVRGKQYPKGGVATYPVTCGAFACNYPGYYVPVKNVKLGGEV